MTYLFVGLKAAARQALASPMAYSAAFLAGRGSRSHRELSAMNLPQDEA